MSRVRPATTAGSSREDPPPSASENTSSDRVSPPRDTAQGHHATRTDTDFAGLVGRLLLGTVVPGLGLILAGRRTAGRLVLGLVALALLACGAFVLRGQPVRAAARTLTSP